MPRWNRREKPDYRHLQDVTDEAALVNAIRSPTYGEGDDFRLLAGFQARLVAMWGDRDILALGELVPAREAVRAADPAFFGHGRNWAGAFLHDAVGNLVGWGLRLEVLREEAANGDRAFRMVRREPLFERMGDGRFRRIDAVAERSARGALQREAYRVRHAERIDPEVRRHMAARAGYEIPGPWFRRFPAQLARLQGLAVLVADARDTFERMHHDMHLADQKIWLRCLQERPCSLPREPEGAVLPDEDVEALAGLQL